MSVLGWGLMYSILVHFFLIYTEKRKLLDSKLSYLIIYFPALINIFGFGLKKPTIYTYDLLKTSAGWINVSGKGFFDHFFNAYYIICSLFVIIILWKWKKEKENSLNKKISNAIIFSFAISLILGSLTDILFRNFMLESRPQLGIVFALIPILTIFHMVKKYGIMEEKILNDFHEKVTLISEEHRFMFYKIASIVLIIGSVVYLLTDYMIFNKEITSIIKFSGLVFYIGSYIWIIPYFKTSSMNQDLKMGLSISLMIPLVYIQFQQFEYNSVIWTVPIILMLIAILFNNSKLLFLIFIVSISTGLVIFFEKEDINATIGNVDYQQRLFIYLILASIMYFIRYLYFEKISDYKKQRNLQKKISEISYNFISVSYENIDLKINEMLKNAGEYFGADRGYLFKCDEEMTKTKYSNEWCSQGISPAIDIEDLQLVSLSPWWMKELQTKKKIYIKDVKNLPEEASIESELLILKEVKSLISVPIFNNNELLGFLGFHSVKNNKTWDLEDQEGLQIMGNILSDALVKTQSEKKMNFMAYYDPLTELSNRTYFNLHLDKVLEIAKRKEKLIGVLFLDLDGFKSINDTMGHDSGDKLLVEVAKRLSKNVRASDTVCRFGGDEFLVMFPQIDELEEIKIGTEKIMKIFEEPIKIKGQDFYVTGSCGVAVYPWDGNNSEALIKSADLAMYESKDAGKNRYTFCTEIMKEVIKEKIKLSNDLYRALERNELVLYYQPQIKIESNEIIGLEALIRWKHPEKGIISPGVFIPIAEQTGLIHSIGEWVINTACIQNKKWQEEGLKPIVMAVNLSVEQFRRDNLVKIVSSAIEKSGLEPKYLELEITESIAIKEPIYIIKVLENLKKIGVSISIDDFGTEYSSLSRLKELPVDRIKMAMQFVQGIENGHKDKAIAMVIINLAKSLGLKVIAEGVEVEGQLKFLKDRVCDEVQGYYFYRPMPAEEIEKILQVGEKNDYKS